VIGEALLTILGARREGLLRLRRVTAPTRLECLGAQCAKCCKLIGSAKVDPGEADPLVALDLVRRSPTGLRLRCVGSSCVALQEGACSVYQFRPRACREYPWYNIDGALYFDQGCPGIRHDHSDSPDPETLQSAKSYFTMFPGFLRVLVIGVMKLW
jgi:Fe-S-cluster containining protein